ncbi:MAG TPA: hypothetical protein VFW25_09465 [Silvibacterium sp.]|nr:hypothetical protein [Silvibacterium sp.]
MEAVLFDRPSAFPAPISLSRYIYASTLLGVFSGALYIHVGSTVYFFYMVMVFNLLLMWGFLHPLIFPKWLGWFLLYLLASGLFGVWRGTDSVYLFGKQILAIGLSALYFSNFFHLQDDRIADSWVSYARIAYSLTLVALLMWAAGCLYEHRLLRLHGLTTEPSAYCVLTLPAYYWYAYQWRTYGRRRKEVLWMTLGIALSMSSDGYLAVIFGLFLLFGKRLGGLLIAVVLACAVGVGLYSASSDVRLRVNDTAGALVNSDVSGTNLSTYALISNMFVTERVLEVHPVLGNGLGSHVQSNEKYIHDVPGEDLVEAAGWDSGANVQDASSLTLRSLSEMGVLGFLGILWFIVHFRVKGRGERAAISSAILTVFFQKLLRGGGYSNPEQFFFVMVYLLNYRQAKLEDEGRRFFPQGHSLCPTPVQNR